eukprot:2713543-Alexandrium_andersonii.AAC.1
MASHSWERAPQAHSWEDLDEVHVTGWDASSDEEHEPNAVESSELFLDHTLGLRRLSKLSALQFCVAMHWAAKSGISAASEYGLPPGKPTGHYQRHLDK